MVLQPDMTLVNVHSLAEGHIAVHVAQVQADSTMFMVRSKCAFPVEQSIYSSATAISVGTNGNDLCQCKQRSG